MPETPQIDANELERWFAANLIPLLVIGILLLVLYLFSSRIVHVFVARALAAQTRLLVAGSVEAAELEKRSATLESLIATVLRFALIGFIVILVIGFLGLWSLLAGIGLFLAALTLAGQSIVLDYLMGILIILEGQFYKGDVIAVGEHFGAVEDVGLRRTTIRGPNGTVHSISNGEIRVVSNRTRVYAAAEVNVRGIREEDFQRVVEIMARVGREVAGDPRFADSIIEAHELKFVPDPDDLGMAATMRGKVVAARRWDVATEIRQRLNQALLEADIELNKRGVAPRITRGGGEMPPYVPEDDGDEG